MNDIVAPAVEAAVTVEEIKQGFYRNYCEAQDRVGEFYCDPAGWTRMSIPNTARSGKFSSDRSIRDYCKDVWHAKPVQVQLDAA